MTDTASGTTEQLCGIFAANICVRLTLGISHVRSHEIAIIVIITIRVNCGASITPPTALGRLCSTETAIIVVVVVVIVVTIVLFAASPRTALAVLARGSRLVPTTAPRRRATSFAWFILLWWMIVSTATR